jgi:citrate synthase
MQQPAPSVALGRLSVLSQHLAAGSLDQTGSSGLARAETRAVGTGAAAGGEDEVRPAPGGGPGTLTVLDNRTGKRYTVSVWWCVRACARGGEVGG